MKAVASAGTVMWESDASVTGRTRGTSVARGPAADARFVTLTVGVAVGRSLGRNDYALRARGREFPCLGLRVAGTAFSRNARPVLANNVARNVDLVFEVPTNVESAVVVLTLPVTVPQAPVDLDLTGAAVYDAGPSF